jgi:pyruvate formate lyase activating enzyme
MPSSEDTRAEDLERAAAIGQQSGLRYVYCGNLPGRVREQEDTRCPRCRHTVIRRQGYWIEDYQLTVDGSCPNCKTAIPGRWSKEFNGQIASTPFLPRSRARLVRIQARS